MWWLARLPDDMARQECSGYPLSALTMTLAILLTG